MKFHVITLFPELVDAYAAHSIIGRAIRNNVLSIKAYQLRDYARNKWNKVDDRPYAGGPGMVLQAEPMLRAAEKAMRGKKKVGVIVTSAGGKQFTNADARVLAKKYDHLVFIAGHYEGIDARVTKVLKAKEYSVGPYILTGGEVPALIMMDAIARQLPGTLGKFESLEEGRVSSHDTYTRPEVLLWKGKKYRVPKVLLSGNHKLIEAWKQKRK
jgi:tRNA (guanine37-N1)-methyltransferase